MLKKSLLYCSILVLLSMQATFAESAQLHFSTIGGPSMAGQMSSDVLDANLINDAAVRYNEQDRQRANANKQNYQNYNKTNMPDNEYNLRDNTQYNFKRGSLNTTQENEMYNEESSSGVNSSKTMYTDELGRLHFFGKGNITRE